MAFSVSKVSSKGFLPKELPPGFTGRDFGAFVASTDHRWPSSVGRVWREFGTYSLVRSGGTRRTLGLTNPISFVDVASEISKLWPRFQNVYRQGLKYSSAPNIDTRNSRPRYLRNRYSFEDLPSIRMRFAATGHYRLKTDISQCYGSIYTHSVPWVFVGKAKVKQSVAVGRGSTKRRPFTGDQLDKALMCAQHGQTIGIPIGSDLSHAVAELILCSIDRELLKKYSHAYRDRVFPAIRMIDDLEVYTSSRSEAEDMLSNYERAAAKWGLQLNPSKVRIDSLPTYLDSAWITPLSQFQFGNSARSIPRKLRQFIDLAFGFAGTEEERKAILGYAIKIVTESLVPLMDNRLFDAWLDILCAAIYADPSSLRFAYESIARAKECGRVIRSQLLEETLDRLLNENYDFNRSHEVSWSLAIATQAGIHIDYETAGNVSRMEDNVSNILLVHMAKNGLINRSNRLDSSQITDRACELTSLQSPNWLIAYEFAAQGWTNGWHVRRTPFFREMLAAKVKFFDSGVYSVPSSPSRMPQSLEQLFSTDFSTWFASYRTGISYGQS